MGKKCASHNKLRLEQLPHYIEISEKSPGFYWEKERVVVYNKKKTYEGIKERGTDC